jgi:hypothetical protein
MNFRRGSTLTGKLMRDFSQTDFFDKTDPLWQHPKPQSELIDSERQINTIKAARQYYMNGLLDNNWYSEP